ncbi:MAG: N-acetylmuramic acid 6-phosphate etherase [Anaerolineae bacterium]|nr:N-acetylmuramic acid 6-phosphate etherase [Anaerolineae bacterium]
MLTEKRSERTVNIDRLDTLAILEVMNDEDATVPGAVRRVLPAIAQAVDTIVEHLQRGGRLLYVGAGTSGRLGVLDAVECVPTFNTDPDMVQGIIAGGPLALTHAVEGAEDDRAAGYAEMVARNVSERDVVVGIAASGQTPYVLGALEAANTAGAATVAITCNEPAPMLDLATILIVALVGPEVIAGSTRLKAGTAQKLILNMLSTASMIRLGKVYQNLMVDMRVTNQKLMQRARRIVAEISGVSSEEADRLLAQAGGEIKTAIVMALLGIGPEVARARIAAAGGVLREAIGDRD